MSTAAAARGGGVAQPAGPAARRQSPRAGRVASYIILTVMAVGWLIPLLWALYTSLRPKAVTDAHGYFSFTGPFTLSNFSSAWKQAGFAKYFINSAIITIPTVLITLVLAAFVAFAVSRFAWKLNVTLLLLFTAGNLLPPQVLATPIYQMFKHTPVPLSISDSGSLLNTYYGVIAINVAFQLGFCTFVLSNYMKTLPDDLGDAAFVDGADVFRQFWQIILPLTRPALAALGTLEFIWIYNDFFWPLLLIQNGDRLPVTTGINNLKGAFVDNDNLIAAGAIMTVIPTLIVYLVLQRQFVAGLTLGSTKG